MGVDLENACAEIANRLDGLGHELLASFSRTNKKELFWHSSTANSRRNKCGNLATRAGSFCLVSNSLR